LVDEAELLGDLLLVKVGKPRQGVGEFGGERCRAELDRIDHLEKTILINTDAIPILDLVIAIMINS